MQAQQSVTPLDITPQNVGATARRKPLGKRRDSRPLPTGNELGDKAMDTDELLAVLRSDIQGVNRRIDDFRSDVKEQFDQVGKRFEQVDKRLEQVDKRINGVETRFDMRFDSVDRRFDAVERRFEELSKDLRATKAEFTQRLDNLNLLRLQGASLIAAIAATAAVVGTFLLQLYALL